MSGGQKTIRLYSAQSDATPFVAASLNSNNIQTLTLAFDCLEETLVVQSSVRVAFDERLLNGLESTDKALFKLAAETHLSRRLNKLLRVNENKSVDTSYISCAEYQLFIDEQRQQNKYYQPDHWLSSRFPDGMANNSIFGVNSSNAQAFCKWLSSRTGQNYRLPNLDEIQAYRIANNAAGPWISSADGFKPSLLTISESNLQHWRASVHSSLLDFIQKDFDLAKRIYSALNLDLESVLKLLLARVSQHNIDLTYPGDLTRILPLIRKLDLSRPLKLAFDHNRNLILTRDLDRKQGLKIEQQQNSDFERNIELANDRLFASVSKTEAAEEKVNSLQELIRNKVNDAYISNTVLSENPNYLELEKDLDQARQYARYLSTSRNSENEYIRRQKT